MNRGPTVNKKEGGALVDDSVCKELAVNAELTWA